MKTIPLTVLVHDGPIARGHLAALSQAGFHPERIILMIQDRHPGTGKQVGKWLPARFRLRLAEKAQFLSMFHWPRLLRATNEDLCQQLISGISEALDFPASLFDALDGRDALENYSGVVERVIVADLDDPVLAELLGETAPATVLFTGGGIVPRHLLEIPELRVLHTHPGYLPDVRGSDGLLWSYLVHGHPGASCFYMAPGIDVGDVIAAEKFSAITFPISETKRPDDQTLYRLIYSLFDPVLRARTFLNALSLNDDPAMLPSNPQDGEQGITYHFMSPEVRRASLLRVFPETT